MVQISIGSDSFQQGKEALPSLLAALPRLPVGSSRSLHNVTYVTHAPPDCPLLPGAGEALLLSRGGKSCGSRLGFSCGVPFGIFPSGCWGWSLGTRLCGSVLPSAGMGMLAASPGSRALLGAAGSAPLLHNDLHLPHLAPCLSCPFFPVVPLRLMGELSGYSHTRAAWSKSVCLTAILIL